MKTTKVALIIPLFDNIPDYFDLFLNQLSYQRNIDILILSNLELEGYQFLPHIENHRVKKTNNLEEFIKSDFEWFISTRTYWAIGSAEYLYGNLFKFVHQLTKNNPMTFELKGINQTIVFHKSIPNGKEIDVILSNAELVLTSDNIISFNQGRIFNYFNRRSFAFMNINKAIRNNLFSLPKWTEVPHKFYLSKTGFYNEKEFRNYNILHLQHKIKTKGLRYFFSIRHFIKRQINEIEVTTQQNEQQI